MLLNQASFILQYFSALWQVKFIVLSFHYTLQFIPRFILIDQLSEFNFSSFLIKFLIFRPQKERYKNNNYLELRAFIAVILKKNGTSY